MSSHRWLGLDGLRGVAVVAVVLFHAGLLPGGFMGVDVFFVLSGFLITRILRAEHARTGTIRLGRFTARRLLRLYPALLAVCMFVLTISVVAQRAVPAILQEVLVSLTYTSNLIPTESGLLDHTWTLSLEEQFYLVWPPLLLLGLISRSVWGWLPAGLLLAFVLLTDVLTGQSGALHTYVRAMGLPLGCLLGFASGRELRRLGYTAPLAAVGFVVALIVPLPGWLTTGWPISIGAVLAAPMLAALITWRVPPMEWPLTRWFGMRSYSLYLWHLPLMTMAIFFLPAAIPSPFRAAIGVILSLVAAEMSYRFVERPVLVRRDRIRPQPVADPGPSTDDAEQGASPLSEGNRT